MPAKIEINDEVAIITMDDGKANAINPTMLTALNACLDEAEASAKAVVLTGRPERFSAGFDLKLMASSPPDEVVSLVKAGGRLALRLHQFKTPVIVASTGHAIAMGCFILLASDLRIGADGPYKVGANETVINMVLPVFALELLKARIPARFLTQSAINGQLYSPHEAVATGFLDEVTAPDKVLETALQHAHALKAISGPAYHSNKKLIRKATLDAIAPTVAA